MREEYAVGKIIRQIRVNHRLTQEKMAELIETGLRNYQNIEAGYAPPNYKMLVNLVEKLHVDPQLLLTNQMQTQDNPIKQEIDVLVSLFDESWLELIRDLIQSVLTNIQKTQKREKL